MNQPPFAPASAAAGMEIASDPTANTLASALLGASVAAAIMYGMMQKCRYGMVASMMKKSGRIRERMERADFANITTPENTQYLRGMADGYRGAGEMLYNK